MTVVADLAPQLESAATAFVREHRLPGAAVGIVHGDELAWSAGIGFANVEAARAPKPSTLYRIASITKTFTGTAIMQLRDEGKLHLDDAAVTYLPELRAAISPFGLIDTVTIRRMLSHESGMMSEPPETDWSKPVYEGDPTVNLGRAASLGTRLPPNAQTKYSNLSYQLLGEIVARVSGMPYDDYLQTNILTPLGLTSTGSSPWGRGLLDVERWATPRAPSTTGWCRRLRWRRCTPRAGCGHVSPTSPAGSRSSYGRTVVPGAARRCSPVRRSPRCIAPATSKTTCGRRPSGSRGTRNGAIRCSGCSTRVDCPGSPPTSASTRARRWARSR